MATITPAAPEWIRITPNMASDWLKFNTHNRNMRLAWVDSLAKNYRDFHPNPISISHDGTILDGQHRLMAIAKSGTPRWVLIAKDIPADMQNVIDTGKARTSADVLSLNGQKNAAATASAARFCMIWEREPINVIGSYEITPVEILEYIKQHPELEPHVANATSLAKRAAPRFKQPTGSRFGVASLVISRAFGDAYAQSYLRSLILGVDINEESVIYVVRQRLLSISSNKDHAIVLDPRKNGRMALWLVLRGAVAHRSGEKLTRGLYRNNQSPMPINLDGSLAKKVA